MEQKKFYVTTPIYYPNGNFHLGTCYPTVLADCIARYRRARGYDVFFLTGTDEHGQKIEQVSAKAGKTPKEYVDEVVADAKDLWRLLNISYNKFIRTTDEYHEKAASKIFDTLYEKGEIYKSSYEGLYCVPCETFYTKTQASDGLCPECHRPVETAKEEAYFFRLSKYQKQIEKLLKDPNFVRQERTRNEMYNNFVKPGLEDLCLTRTSVRWGIPVSFDPKHTIYVWVDALTNYITALGYDSDDESLFEKFWPADLHIVGKEITRFHTIIWPALLWALGLPLPKEIHAHGWLTNGGAKMGKSLGNGFYPRNLIKYTSVDALRYYLLKEGPLVQDAPYTTENYLNVINKDLCNMLGNLLSRTSAMAEQYFSGELPYGNTYGEEDDELLNQVNSVYAQYVKDMDEQEVKHAIEKVISLIDAGNKYIDATQPWNLAKDETERERLSTVLYNITEVLRVSAILLTPMIPESCDKIFSALGVGKEYQTFDQARYVANRDSRITKIAPLFPRLKVQETIKLIEG